MPEANNYQSKKNIFGKEMKKSVNLAIQFCEDKIKFHDNQVKKAQFTAELPEVLKAMKVDGYESPEPGDLPKDKAEKLADIYAACRKDGNEKEKCAKIAWGAINKMGK